MNILIVRTSAMGDIIHCLPVLSALRRELPRAKIAWMVEKTFAPILLDHADLDELIPVRMRQYRKAPWSRQVRRELAEVRAVCRRFAPDVALDLMGNHKSALLGRLSGARRIVGPARRDRREPSSALWIHQGVATPSRHAVDRALDVLAGIGLVDLTVDFAGAKLMPTPPPEAQDFLERNPAPFVAIQAGAGWANKCYPAPWWGEVARLLRERTGLPTWVPVAPGEEDLAAAVVDASRGAARSVDATRFSFLAALLRHSRLLLGGDTGPVHLAHALGTPVLCVMGPTDPLRNGPYDAPQNALWHTLPCSFCHKRFDGPRACLLELSASRIAERAAEILAG